MPGPVAFLQAFAHALAALSLYPEKHVSRERALDGVYGRLCDVLESDPNPAFSFLGDEVVYGNQPLRDLRDWEWSSRLAGIGVQRLQFDETTSREELEDFLVEILARLTLRAIDTAEARPTRPSGIRFGSLGIRGHEDAAGETPTATISFSLQEEADTIRWLHDELSSGRPLPLAEAEAVVRALSVAMQGEQQAMLPLLTLRRFDEYTTTHSLNVSVLGMALAEWMGLGARDVRAFGVAGLLHDLGKVTIPPEVLTKPGKLTVAEREIVRNHTVAGARIILQSEPDLDLAAVVAYEHHIMLNGSGYPTLRFARDCHRASKLIHVCDVYDALRTNRPYRDAWPAGKVMAYVDERAGVEFDEEIAGAFTQMMQAWEPRIATMGVDEEVPELH